MIKTKITKTILTTPRDSLRYYDKSKWIVSHLDTSNVYINSDLNIHSIFHDNKEFCMVRNIIPDNSGSKQIFLDYKLYPYHERYLVLYVPSPTPYSLFGYPTSYKLGCLDTEEYKLYLPYDTKYFHAVNMSLVTFKNVNYTPIFVKLFGGLTYSKFIYGYERILPPCSFYDIKLTQIIENLGEVPFECDYTLLHFDLSTLDLKWKPVRFILWVTYNSYHTIGGTYYIYDSTNGFQEYTPINGDYLTEDDLLQNGMTIDTINNIDKDTWINTFGAIGESRLSVFLVNNGYLCFFHLESSWFDEKLDVYDYMKIYQNATPVIVKGVL